MERPISAKALAEVQAAIFKGEKITAIKIYREDTGASLADAKNAVEKLESEWRAASPENFNAPTKQKGCGVCLALIVFGVLASVLLLFFARRGG